MSVKLPVRTAPPPPSHQALQFWRFAQASAVAALVAAIVGLVAAPELTLDLLWNGAVPLLPALFLVSPPVWRNICPVATLNMLASDLDGAQRRVKRRPSELRTWGGAGILLFFLLVPARHLLFNTNGPALAGVLIGVGVFAAALGIRYANKSGFCNALCPVLPVERLYGQSPLVQIANPRCLPCVTCSARGCIDRSPEAALAEAMDYPKTGRHWLFTPFGSFAVAFPGFVFGYFRVEDVPLAEAGVVYGTIGFWAAGSWLLGAALSSIGLPRPLLMRGSATVAIAIYYWFAASSLQTAWGFAAEAEAGIRVLAAALIGVWLIRATVRDRAAVG